MIKKIILYTLITGMSASLLPEAGKDKGKIEYEVQIPENPKPSESGLNMYFPVHYVYMNVLAVLGLDQKLDLDSKIDIVTRMTQNISESGARLVIKKFDGKNDLFIVMRTDSNNPKKKKLLWIVSNYNASRHEVILKEDDMEFAYATFFEFFNDSIVKFQNIDSKEMEAKYKEEKDLNSLADLYLFDSQKDNDKEIPVLLDKNLSESTDISGKFISHLTYLQYHLSLKDYDKAQKDLENASEFLKGDIKDKDKFDRFIKMAKDEFEITKKVVSREK